jgi:hypothetical protein
MSNADLKAKLRAEAPDMAKHIDGLREVFGADQVKIAHLKIGSQEFGKPLSERDKQNENRK